MQHNHQVIELFESIIADFAGSKYAVAVDCCTHAIFLSLKYYIDHDKAIYDRDYAYVTIPEQTYVSVPSMAIQAGYRVKFTSKQWHGIYKLDPLPVIDGAGRFMKDMYVPGTLHCLSFGSKKILSTGKGGMILTDDSSIARWLTKARYAGRSSPFYNDINDIDILGWHMQMTPEVAARGIEAFYGLTGSDTNIGSSQNRKIISKFSAFKDHIVE